MRLQSLLTLLVLAVAGCKNPAAQTHVQASLGSDSLSYQLANLGIARIRSTYSLASGSFQSTCSGVLLHSGDKALSECVALSAASCFKHMPRITEHSIEFFDPDGRSSKLFRVHDILIPPSFDAPDAQLSLLESASDLALVKFNCALPVSVRSARIADFSQVPVNGKLLAVNHLPSDDDSSSIRLTRSKVRIESIDFPGPRDTHENSPELPGVLALRNTGDELECSGNPGSPVFYQSGRELLLIASLSMPAADCMRSNHRYTLLSPHIQWMKKVLGTGAVSYEAQLNKGVTGAADSNTGAPLPETEITTQSLEEKSDPTPLGIPLTLPRASAFIQSAAMPRAETATSPTVTSVPEKTGFSSHSKKNKSVSGQLKETTVSKVKQPVTFPTDSQKNAKNQVLLRTNSANRSAAKRKPTLQPKQEVLREQNTDSNDKPLESPIEIQPFQDRIDIPPPIPQNQCMGRRMVANSKTRVWGTVIKLIDRPSNEILDERMKCDIPNEVEICLNAELSPANSGHVSAQLLADVEQGGCEKFKSGETVYFLKTDFLSY
ncbi:MAG: hypothetical protein RJB13_234 [Pseudomonadota bacterium]